MIGILALILGLLFILFAVLHGKKAGKTKLFYVLLIAGIVMAVAGTVFWVLIITDLLTFPLN